jgi:hypothetical protein
MAKMLAASLLMAVVLYLLKTIAAPYLETGEIKRFLVLFAIALAGLASYLLACWALDIMNLRALARKRVARS